MCMSVKNNFISYSKLVKSSLKNYLSCRKVVYSNEVKGIEEIFLGKSIINKLKNTKVKYKFSLIDNFLKMKSFLQTDLALLNENKTSDLNCKTKPFRQHYSFNTSFGVSGSYTSFSSHNSYSYNSSYGLYTSLVNAKSYKKSYSHSYGSFSYYANSHNYKYKSFAGNSATYAQEVLNDENYFEKSKVELIKKIDVRAEYKNEYLYRASNIKQEFFVMGYGLELI